MSTKPFILPEIAGIARKMRRIRKYQKQVVFFLVLLLPFLYGCYPEGPEAVEDYDVVVTNHDSSFNFTSLRTYYLLDTIVHVTQSTEQRSSSMIDRALDQAILDQVATELNSLGYTRLTSISSGQRPDVLVAVSGLATTSTSYYYDNWWNYYDWWDGWNAWYPSYNTGWSPYWSYPYAYSYSYAIGTLMVEMSSPNQGQAQQQRFPLIWRASLNGLLTNNAAHTQARITAGLHQAFVQSPYLRLK